MINASRKVEDKACNCRNSKCIKLYCECFAARIPCGSSCHCIDCHNTLVPEQNQNSATVIKRLHRQDSIKSIKGCACRKSGCTKKYCQCYQAGIRCGQSCKCVDCQNNQSMVNKKAVTLLRENCSDISPPEPNQSLYPLYIAQSQNQMNCIIRQSDPLCLGNLWLEQCAISLIQQAQSGGKTRIIEGMIEIIQQMQKIVLDKDRNEEQLELIMDQPNFNHQSLQKQQHSLQQQENQQKMSMQKQPEQKNGNGGEIIDEEMNQQ